MAGWRACRGLCAGGMVRTGRGRVAGVPMGQHRGRAAGAFVKRQCGQCGGLRAYALLCLLPAGIALRDIRHRWPLVGFSAVLGPALYFLINPGLLAQRMGGLPQEVIVAMLGQLIRAAALACAVWLLLGALHRRT